MEERPHLYIIPIAHTYADMGNLRDKIPFNEIPVSTPEMVSHVLPEVLQDFYSLGKERK